MRMQKSILSMPQSGTAPSICLAYQSLKLIISMAFRAPQVSHLNLSVGLDLSVEIFRLLRDPAVWTAPPQTFGFACGG
jgi:hypothetical protein